MNWVIEPLAGGMLIGLAATALLWVNGRIAGISGILGGCLVPRAGDIAWRVAFVAGLIAGGLLLAGTMSAPFGAPVVTSPVTIGLAGLLVGVGTRVGNGCTSGHGVCGISRGSVRGMAATLTFMTTGALTVWLTHQLGVGVWP